MKQAVDDTSGFTAATVRKALSKKAMSDQASKVILEEYHADHKPDPVWSLPLQGHSGAWSGCSDRRHF